MDYGYLHFKSFNIKTFSDTGKDVINEETIELMQPYLKLEQYNSEIAKKASNAAEGLCVWSRAMNDYHEASKIVKPKLEALSIAQAEMDKANAALAAAEKRLAACQALLDELQAKFDAQMAEKKKSWPSMRFRFLGLGPRQQN